MWCAFVPACRSMCSVSRAALATARKNSSADLVLEAGDVARRAAARSRVISAYGRPEMSIAHGRARLVHRHHGVPVADDPAAVAERLVERLAEHDPGVLDRVVRAGLQVAGDRDLEVQPAVAGEQVEHVVEEADAGRAGAGAGAGQAERERDVGLAGLAGELRGAGHGRRSSDVAAIEAAWAGKPSASRDRHAGARQRGRGVVEPDLGHAAPEVADVEAGGEARGALGGQRVVRTRDVVAERGAGGVADEQAAGVADARRERLRRRARELQVLGGQRLGEGQRGRPCSSASTLLVRVQARRGSPGRR